MAHVHEKIDFTVAIYIVHNNKVLMINHRELKKWLPIGGHVQLDEDTDQALERKIKEESGLTVKVHGERPDLHIESSKSLYVPSYMNIHAIDDTHQHIGLVYFGTSDSDAVIEDTAEYSEFRWFSADDLEKESSNIQADVLFYAEQALRTLA